MTAVVPVAKLFSGELPALHVLSPDIGPVISRFIDPDGPAHQKWYPMEESGDALIDDEIRQSFWLAEGELIREGSKSLFRKIARSVGDDDERREELIKAFACMYQTPHATGSDLHPKLRDLGCVHFYGGFRRRFDATANIRAPIWAGEHVSLRSSCKVLGPSLLGDRVKIGTSAIVNRSIVGHDTEIDAAAQVADSFIGQHVYVGPGAKLLHKPFPQNGHASPISVELIGKQRSLTIERPKCGVAVGDHCQIGRDAILEPGTVLLPGCIVRAGAHLSARVYRPEDIPMFS